MAAARFIPFKVLIDCPFRDIALDKDLSPIDKKYNLSMVNDYEDGKWRLDVFLEYIWDNIAETALSAEEREALGGRPSSLLTKAAKNLRITDNDISGGEIAEILLYSIMRNYYNALPVVPKIYYKQNVNDFAKGADSVHIVIEDNGKFSLWLGEAKFYNDISNARLDTVVNSVYETLSSDKIRKENSIIVGLKDINNLGIPDEILDKIKELLSGDTSIDRLKPHLHVPILLLHECEITASSHAIDDAYIDAIRSKHAERATAYFSKQITKCKDAVYLYSEITFHLILIPVPNKKDIVDKFVERAKMYR